MRTQSFPLTVFAVCLQVIVQTNAEQPCVYKDKGDWSDCSPETCIQAVEQVYIAGGSNCPREITKMRYCDDDDVMPGNSGIDGVSEAPRVHLRLVDSPEDQEDPDSNQLIVMEVHGRDDDNENRPHSGKTTSCQRKNIGKVYGGQRFRRGHGRRKKQDLLAQSQNVLSFRQDSDRRGGSGGVHRGGRRSFHHENQGGVHRGGRRDVHRGGRRGDRGGVHRGGRRDIHRRGRRGGRGGVHRGGRRNVRRRSRRRGGGRSNGRRGGRRSRHRKGRRKNGHRGRKKKMKKKAHGMRRMAGKGVSEDVDDVQDDRIGSGKRDHGIIIKGGSMITGSTRSNDTAADSRILQTFESGGGGDDGTGFLSDQDAAAAERGFLQ